MFTIFYWLVYFINFGSMVGYDGIFPHSAIAVRSLTVLHCSRFLMQGSKTRLHHIAIPSPLLAFLCFHLHPYPSLVSFAFTLPLRIFFIFFTTFVFQEHRVRYLRAVDCLNIHFCFSHTPLRVSQCCYHSACLIQFLCYAFLFAQETLSCTESKVEVIQSSYLDEKVA